LLSGPATLPQIDVSQMPDPGAGHLKVHFWVNGGGLVTRELLTSGNFATPEERQAELAYTNGLIFRVPDTTECSSREMELVGDYFEMKGVTEQWATYVKLYPRLTLGNNGVVQSRD
jgi:hypothetical protein